MSLKCGIVGLPNVGKSTLFNALTETVAAEAANYPFCTIEPNVGTIAVPDDRLKELARIEGSQKILPTTLEFVDIAGIVEGAHSGQGLGNKFLANIRETDAILHVVRCFDNDDITHVAGRVDPMTDIRVIENELMLADLESIEGRLPNLEKKAKKDESLKKLVEMTHHVRDLLQNSQPASKLVCKDNEETELLKQMQLLTSKPMLYICNMSEDQVATGNDYTKQISEMSGGNIVMVSAQIESEIAALESQDEKDEFLASIGLSETGLSKLVRSCYKLLGLITYFTVGPKETRAWTINVGTKAPAAACVIHTDFERGFICAETISYHDFVSCGGYQGAKTAGKARLEGKEYVMQDGDVVHFRFNV